MDKENIVLTLDYCLPWHLYVFALLRVTLIRCDLGEADVAYATSDGSVGFVKIRQQLVAMDIVFPFAYGYRIETTVVKDCLVYNPSFAAEVSAVQWLQIPNRNVCIDLLSVQQAYHSTENSPSL